MGGRSFPIHPSSQTGSAIAQLEQIRSREEHCAARQGKAGLADGLARKTKVPLEVIDVSRRSAAITEPVHQKS